MFVTIFYLLHFTTTVVTIWEIFDENNTEDLIQNCLNKILNEHSKNNEVVITVNLNFGLNHPVVNLQLYQIVDLEVFSRPKTYIISLSENLTEILEFLSDLPIFNPQAKFIVISVEANEDFFKIASRYYISHICLLETPTLNLYTYNPYNNEDIHNPDTSIVPLGSCFEGVPLFSTKIPTTWQNSTVRISYKPNPPYVIDPYSNALKGMEIFALETIKKYYKFETEYFYHNGSFYNVKEPETYFSAFGDLLTHEVDIAVGAYFLKNHEHFDFEVSYPYLQDSFFWVVPKGRELQKWQRIILAFSFETWMAFTASFVIFSVLYLMQLNFFRMQVSSKIFLYLFRILIEHPAEIPRKYTVRGLLGTWIFYCLIISTAFKSQIINLLSGVSYQADIASLKEIVESDLIINLPSSYANLYEFDEDPIEKYIFDHNIKCVKIFDCLKRTAEQRDTASIAIGRYIDYYSPYFLNEHGHRTVHVMAERVCLMSIHMMISKGFPMFEQINSLIMLLEANGIVDYNYQYMDNIFKISYFYQLRLTEKTDVNDLKTIALPFILWCFGQCVAVFVLILEFIWFKLNHKKCLPNF